MDPRHRSSCPRAYQARKCSACELRFPVDAGSPNGTRCPRCGQLTEFQGARYRTFGVPPAGSRASASRLDLQLLLDNVRSLRNVGAIFRTADGAGVSHIHLGGVTATPENPKLAKTALDAEESVPWTYWPDSTVAAAALRASGCCLWALEGGPGTESLYAPSVRTAVQRSRSVALVVGHEVSGIDPKILTRCERALHIPMSGRKDTLNVSVALGIAVYTIRFAW